MISQTPVDFNTDRYEDYSLFYKFFVTYSEQNFEGINPNDPLMKVLDSYMDNNSQLFYITDAIQLDIKFISRGVKSLFGIDPDKVATGFFLTTTHPDDLKRHHLARSKLINVAQELYIQKSGTKIISANFRGRLPGSTEYADFLYQSFLFYSKIPYESTFLILVITDISGFEKPYNGFHYYIGNDPKIFRFPDKELLTSGLVLSHAELKIIELLEQGLSTKEIADQLFRSPLTISTHRSNIIKKSGKTSTYEVIRDLKEKGLL
jgi:DNA-binding CsgD family transcriptional regulator